MADGSNPITLGDPVPWFTAPLINGATFDFHVFGGRWVVLAFLGSPANPVADEKIAELMKDDALFDDDRIVVRGIHGVSPISPCSRSTARSHSLRAAFSDRCNSRPISSKVRSSS